jgi:hypothetical protein
VLFYKEIVFLLTILLRSLQCLENVCLIWRLKGWCLSNYPNWLQSS